MVRLPPFMSVFPTGKGITSLVQFNVGAGKPSASQVPRNVECCFGVTSDGGRFVKIGRPKDCIPSGNEKTVKQAHLKMKSCVQS